ncbi:hypothetical protein ACFST9_25550 [Hymenobacter monticola]|uniref:T9SS C-terminal target domain-containing protein n=1 Tax=Hymenobacter monticola TaxID=1705399 RepID=A0ABY4B6A3_9BACT|nr:hypothetical protein [Hymenobacter monticola]UOE34662.1 hypothetical protein MTP16_03185 [Hymenobacter monticola]
MLHRFYRSAVLVAALLGVALPGRAQLLTQTVWENLAPRSPDASQAAYLRVFSYRGQYLAGGCEGVQANLGWPAYLGAYGAGGQVVWQHRASDMFTCEQALLPWGAGFAFVGTAYVPVGSVNVAVPFLEWFTAGGVSVRKQVLPMAQVRTTPSNALREADGGFTMTGFGYDPGTPSTADTDVYTLTRTDSLGNVVWTRVYHYPVRAIPYPNEVLRTARGGYLLTGFAGYLAPGTRAGYTNRPWLVETDAAGTQLRQATLPVAASLEAKAQVLRTFNNTLPLAGGGAYALAGWADSVQGTSARRWGYVACFDTALQLRWTTRLPARRGGAQRPTRVRQLPSGALQVLSFTERQSPYLYLTTLNPVTGAIVREEEFAIGGMYAVGVWDWQAQADSSIVVAGSAERLTARGGAGPQQAWLGRYKLVARLPTAAASTMRAGEPLRAYPSPAGAGEAVRAVLPAGAGAGRLLVRDALGRTLREVAVVAGTTEATLPVAGLPPGLYLVELVPEQADQPRAAARLELR